MKYQLTYEDAVKICKAYKNFNFYPTETRIDNFKVVTFNYFLCDYRYFVTPLREEPEINARDMRGVTFVFNEDGTLYKRFLMLEKFFNLNQVEETQFHILKDKKIKNITVKEDGSLIAFMNLPNGKVFAKTQAGFSNEQSLEAMKIYNANVKIANFVNDSLKQNFTPLFEYVAFDNRVVLKYTGRELRLIGIRHNETGNYHPAHNTSAEIMYGIRAIERMEGLFTLEQLVDKMKSSVDIEGIVIQFEDNQLVKIKTDWYFNLHGIRTVNIFREDFVIEHYLSETLDNATQELNMTDDADAFAFIERVKKAVHNWSDHIEKNVDILVDTYTDPKGFYFGNWSKFATDKHKSAFFGLARKKIENPEDYKRYKIGYMLNASKHLMEAKKIVEKWE